MNSRDPQFENAWTSADPLDTAPAGAIDEPVEVEARSFPWLRALVLAVMGGCLVWLVATKSLAAYLAETQPEWALWLNPSEPNALLRIADQQMAQIRTPTTTSPTFGPAASADSSRMPKFASPGLHARGGVAIRNGA